MNQIKILLVGNYRLFYESFARIIEYQSTSNLVAYCNGTENVLSFYIHFEPDIILLDMNIGEIPTIRLIKSLLPVAPSARVVVMVDSPGILLLKKLVALKVKGIATLRSPLCEILKMIEEVRCGRYYASKKIRDQLTWFLNEIHVESASFSEIENKILYYMQLGLGTKIISENLNIKFRMVEMHRYNILKKLQLPSARVLSHMVNKSQSYSSRSIEDKNISSRHQFL